MAPGLLIAEHGQRANHGEPRPPTRVGEEEVPQPAGTGLSLELLHDRRVMVRIPGLHHLPSVNRLPGEEVRLHEPVEVPLELQHLRSKREVHGGLLKSPLAPPAPARPSYPGEREKAGWRGASNFPRPAMSIRHTRGHWDGFSHGPPTQVRGAGPPSGRGVPPPLLLLGRDVTIGGQPGTTLWPARNRRARDGRSGSWSKRIHVHW